MSLRHGVLLSAVSLAACAINNPTQDCGNGIVCPSDLACDLVHRSCVPGDQLEACTGKDELAACTTRMIDEGTCHEGLCAAAACGNGILDRSYGESCDDANLAAGDGCSATCQTEACGNGVVDQGEECDDGNRRSHDGCDSACLREQATWKPFVQIGNPARADAASAYDEARGRLVMFSGLDENNYPTNDTLEWDGETWRVAQPTMKPRARVNAAMAYDAEHHVVVMFGGDLGGNVLSAETWLWDGRRWIDRSSSSAPPARRGHTMAYDGARHRIVLFGGETSLLTTENDTWEWDGSGWSRAEPTTRPPSRTHAAATFDPRSGRIVLTGGSARSGLTYFDDTWFWDGTNWQPGPTCPGRREQAALAFDPSLGVVVIGGLRLGNGGSWESGDMRVLRGSEWALLDDSNIVHRNGHAAFYDRRIGAIAIAGGRLGSQATAFDLWPPTTEMWSGAARDGAIKWSSIVASPGPDHRAWLTSAYDSYRGRTVAFGGIVQIGNDIGRTYHDTWELLDGTWRPRSVTLGPDGASTAGTMAYDARRRRSVLFGGAPMYSAPGTWEWDGTSWQYIPPAAGAPASRAAPAMAYVPELSSVLMSGGDSYNGWLDDAWSWDGNRWTRVSTTPGPGARAYHAMTYDGAHDRVVLFGGDRTDTWTWSPERGWAAAMPADHPTARQGAAMAFDPLRQEVLMVGGNTSNFETWRWNGTTWSQLEALDPPSPRANIALVYDSSREQAILIGTNDATPVTYGLRWESATRDDICEQALDLDGDHLAGCADPDCAAFCASCGDGACDPLETSRLCPHDCGAPTARCGDGFCDPGETSCPGDCTP